MLGVCRERVRQLIAEDVLVGRKEGRASWVSVASVEARKSDPWHRNPTGLKGGG